MTKRFLCILSTLLTIAVGTQVRASEPFQAFLEGLRERGYLDTAVDYLELMSQQKDLPAEVSQTIQFEQAKTLLAQALTTQNPRLENQFLDQAEKLLKDFAQSHPGSELAANANQELAKITLQRARMQIIQALSPANAQDEAALREKARANIQTARATFQQAHDQYKKQWESFGAGFIEDEDKRAERQEKETKYLITLLDLAYCSYEEGQTYPPGSDEFKKILTRASQEFSEIHEKYRSMSIGLHARMMQGKCFEEQNEIGKALGIYQELLDHVVDQPNLITLQNKVFMFQLICLNHEQRKDYQLVVNKADDWLKTAGKSAASRTGLGIRWQKLLAIEHLAEQADRAADQKEKLQRETLAIAKEISRYPGPYKDRARAKIAALETALGESTGQPRTFAAAFNRGSDLVRDFHKLQTQLAETKDNTKRAELESQSNSLSQQAEQTLKLALELADEKTELQDLNKARFNLAYVYYLTNRNYDAFVLGDFLAHKFVQSDAATAQDAAYLALVAMLNLYRSSDRNDRAAEIRLLTEMGQHMAAHWPGSSRTDDARWTIGQALRSSNAPSEAVEWLRGVTASSDHYATAQLTAGQSEWFGVVQGVTRETDPLSEQEVNLRLDAAEKQIRAGIELLQKETGDASKETLIAGKVSLVELLVYRGNYEQAIKELTADPDSVVGFVENVKERDLKGTGPRSVEFAGQCYQLLLRCYVGLQQIDQALAAMKRMETLLGAQSSQTMTSIYIQLGQSIQSEIEQLIVQKDRQRLNQVRQSFDQFLNGLYERQQTMSYNALFWMATTYAGLGEGMIKSDPSTARSYFGKAAGIFRRVGEHKDFPADSQTAIQLKIAYCLRRQGSYSDALTMISDILQQKSNLIDAQFEAAQIAQDWGIVEDKQHLTLAIQGNTRANPPGPIWGWASIGTRLQRMMVDGRFSGDQLSEYKQRFLQARYNMSYCLQQFALKQSAEQRNTTLASVQQELQSFAMLNPQTEADWKSQFNALHREVSQQLGAEPTDLEWSVVGQLPETAVASSSNPGNQTTSASDTSPSTPAVQTEPTTTKESSSTFNMVLFAASLLVGLLFAVGMWFAMNGKGKRRQRPSYGNASPPTFAAVTPSQSTRQRRSTNAPQRTGETGGTPETPRRTKRRPPPE